jgi:hypothetical protein
MHIRVDGQTIDVESKTFTARLEGAVLASFAHRGTGTEFCRQGPVAYTTVPNNVVPSSPGQVRGRGSAPYPLELTYANGDALGLDKKQQVVVRQLSELAARVILVGNDSDRELFISLDPESGDLCVRPSGQSARPGVVSVRWNVSFAREARLVLPCVNGILVEAEREFPPDDRFPWPFRWNAQLVIAERGGASMMLHSQDTACKFKALSLRRYEGLSTLGFESEQLAPVWDNRAAGGVEWRLNAYDGDWRRPADRYREWLEATYHLAAKRAARPGWVEDITFSIGWADAKPELLDALAQIHPPKRTLIHLAQWRTSAYDVDYPDYLPSGEAQAYLAKANQMGFKVMPHFNYMACYDKHPTFQKLRDWQVRDPYLNEPLGWYWPADTHDYTRIAYIHPGLALWRRTLIDAILGACGTLSAPAAFIDQTLCTWNAANGLVENMTMVEGMRELQEEFVAVHPEMVLAGEGLNEISFQRQCFAQGHIHDGWGALAPHHIDAAHPICSYLWWGHTRLVGYYHLGPQDKDVDIGIEVYRRMGAIPTLICNDARLIRPDQPVVERLLELVG